ncbi:MAG TPA: lamin tail domain-containing protein, partial [Verrucomicrobiota bacterium]|nr:lamin tail domain-containing protein [Verrucomicrobiota bacterium]
MKNYIDIRGDYLDSLAADALIPNRPVITYTGPENYPINKLSFRTSSFSTPSTTNTFGYIKWRIAEITDTNISPYMTNKPFKYEIESVWESGKITNLTTDITIPAEYIRTGSRYRVRAQYGDNYGRASSWSLPIEFVVSQPDNAELLKRYLRITEIMYNPPTGGYEYIELRNISSDVTLDLAGVKFTQGIDFTFSTGDSIAPGEYIIVAGAPSDNNFAAFRTFYGINAMVKIFGPFSGKLDNAGEQIVLRTAAGGSDIINFTYDNSRGWPLSADGAGHSLVFNDSYLYEQNNYANYPGSWSASAFIKGSPGSADPVLSSQQVLINEVIINSDFSNPALSNNWIELYNPSSPDIILGDGWFLSDDPAALNKWGIPASTVVPANGFVALNLGIFTNQTLVNLSKAGGQVYLSYIKGGNEDRVVDIARFKGTGNGLSWGRYPDGNPYWSTLSRQTVGSTNAAPIKTLVISEIYFHPPDLPDGSDNTQDEFIEIFNPSPTTITMSQQWRIDGGVEFYFPTNVSIASGEYALIVNFDPTNTAQLDAFKFQVGISNSNLKIFGPYSGKLANDGERVALEYQTIVDATLNQTAFVIADEVIYFDRSPWPCGADGSGNSIQRVNTNKNGNDPENWNAQLPTPGLERTPIPPGVPEIVAQPRSKIVPTNANVSFAVSLCGTPPYTYQWMFNGNYLINETNSTLNLYNVRLTDSGEYSVVVGNSAGAITSAVAVLIVQLPPEITLQPQSLITTGYTTVIMTVAASGTEPIYYQWLFNGIPIQGATNSVLTLTNVNKSNEGQYNVIVYNSAGSSISSTATLTLMMPPFIEQNPQSTNIIEKSTTIFTVQAIGDPPLYYQWLFNGNPIDGANSTSLIITNASDTDEGDYSVIVTNQYGIAISEPAHLTVLVRPYITMHPTPSSVVVP